MFLKFRADGDTEDTLYEIRFDKTPRSRAVIAEKLYSKACGERRTWEQLKADATNGSIAARSVVLWLAQSVTHPTLRFEDIPDVDTGSLGMEYSKQELRLMRGAIERNTTMLEAEKALALEQLGQAIDEAPAGSDEPDPEPDPEVEETEGKAVGDDPTGELSTSSETSTG